MIIFIILIIAIVGVAIYFALPIIKEEMARINEEMNEAQKEKQKEVETKKKADSLKSIFEEKSIEEILEKISDDPKKIQKFKIFLKEELNESMKRKDSARVLKCNQGLKAIQNLENN